MGAVGCWSEGWAAATGPNGHMAAGYTLFWGARGHIAGRHFGEIPAVPPEAYAIVGSTLGILVNSFPIVRIVA